MSLLARANELAAEGHEVIHLEVGEPDFETPEPIRKAGLAAIRDGETRYTDAQGSPELREKIASFYLETAGIEVSSSRTCCICSRS